MKTREEMEQLITDTLRGTSADVEGKPDLLGLIVITCMIIEQAGYKEGYSEGMEAAAQIALKQLT